MIVRLSGVTFADFIAWEQEQQARHELIGGQIVAFAGSSLDHSSISSNIVTKLRATVEPPMAYGKLRSRSREWARWSSRRSARRRRSIKSTLLPHSRIERPRRSHRGEGGF